ncbi:hypothetical protein ScPMuIL_004995 [Solemya velum]
MASGQTPDKQAGLPRGLIGRTGTPAAKGGRLPSIRAPRDLTLGGIPKKVFAPNLLARKEKQKEESSQSGIEPVKKDIQDNLKNENKRVKSGVGRGRGRMKEVIQSHSIFEQGPTEKAQARGASRYNDTVRSDSEFGSRFKTPSKNSLKKTTDERTKKVLDQLLSDDFLEMEDDEEKNLIPVRLPLASVVKREIKTEVNQVKIKAESDDDDIEDEPVDKPANRTSVTTFRSREDLVTCSQLFTKQSKSEEGELLFLQLPEILPGTPARPSLQASDQISQKPEQTVAHTPQDKATDKAKDTDSENVPLKNSSCSLREFSEGLIGKLVIRKSGRTQLVLGNITLDVSMGTPCAFLQDLASIRTSGDSGDLTVLGHVKQRLVCTPDFNMLLNTAT